MSYNASVLLPNGKQYLTQVLYTRAEANGVTVLAVASIISLIAVIGLLSVLALSAFNTRFSDNDQLFVRTHVAAYFISMLVCEILLAIGSIMSIKWVQENVVYVGNYCTAQAIIKQTADVGTAIWSLILAIHTFCVLFLEWKPQAYARWLTLIAGWSFIATITFAGPATANRLSDGPFHGISGYWCWISSGYETQRLTLDYLMLFLSAGFSFLLYTLVFLRLRGNILVSGWHIKFRNIGDARKQSWSNHNFGERQLLVIARQMLLYPIAYTIVILPIAAARFSYFAGLSVPFPVTIFCDTIYLLSGFVNVVLFSTTRRVLPARSVLKLVISRPTVQEPDWIDPDSYYPDSDKSGGGNKTIDIEKMTPTEGPLSAGPPTARPPVTPIFKRTESYHSESESDGYYEPRQSDEYSIGMEYSEHPVAQRHNVPQLSVPSQRRRSVETFSSPEEGSHRESIYDLYDSRQSRYQRAERRHSGSAAPPVPMHNISLD